MLASMKETQCRNVEGGHRVLCVLLFLVASVCLSTPLTGVCAAPAPLQHGKGVDCQRVCAAIAMVPPQYPVCSVGLGIAAPPGSWVHPVRVGLE
jgi:hypothetical protein